MVKNWADESQKPTKQQRDRASALRRALTEPEKKLWWHLRNRLPLKASHFRRQVPIGSYVADFCCLAAKLILEVDGNRHGQEAHAAHDERRTRYLNEQGFKVIRFTNSDVMREIDVVLDTILAELDARSLPLAGRVARSAGWGSKSRNSPLHVSDDSADTGISSRPVSSGRSTSTPTPPCKGEGIGGATRADALRNLRQALARAGFETAALDARLLVLGALKIDQTALITNPDAALTGNQAGTLAEYTRRRLAHEPVARILGEREFWGLPFELSPETLIPRPDTETLVETALSLIPQRQESLRIVDFGTGTGCILTALLHELPQAFGLGVDRSAGALRTARRNAVRNGVGDRALFVASDWAEALQGRFDLIVSNPPYIATPVVATLDREVRDHDPNLALDGGPDGLDAYRILLTEARRLLVPGGLMILEIGYDQADALRQLAGGGALDVLAVNHDLAGNPRCVALKQT